MFDARDVDALECNWDMLRLFGTSDIGNDGLVRGWSVAEQSHVWNDGSEPTLRLMLHGSARQCRLQIVGAPFIRPGQPLQDITLYVNGFRLGFWRLRSASVTTLTALIEPEQMFSRGDGVTLMCTFHIPNSISPADLGEGGDRRALGFCFQSLLVSQI